MAEATPQKITIDGKEYDPASLSEAVKQHILNVRLADQELAQLQARVAITRTARQAYVQALQAEMAKSDGQTAPQVEKIN